MKEQIENEGILNVYELAKFYYIKRPGIWRDSVRKKILLHIVTLFVYRMICYFYTDVQTFSFVNTIHSHHLFFLKKNSACISNAFVRYLILINN
jgi:hypothetical protein